MMKLFIAFFISFVIVIPTLAWESVYEVRGNSMAPALMPGDRVVVQEREYESFSQGDLVAIGFAHRPSPFIKRVVAIPGDRIEIKDDRLLVNGTGAGKVDLRKMPSTLKQLARNKWVIPPKNLFALGDNPRNSRDSQRLGLIPFDRVLGKAIKIIKTEPVNQ